MIRTLAALLILSPGFAVAQAVILANDAPPKPGLSLHEEMTMKLEGGTFSLGIGSAAMTGAANAHTRDVVERSYTSPTQQKVEVLDSARSFRLSFGGQGGEPKDDAGHLLNKKLLGTQSEGHWSFALASKQKPDSAEATALRQFGGYTDAVRAFGLLYGTAPRKVGETWKPDLVALKKAAPQVDADLECKLEKVESQAGDQIAEISIKGHLFANINDNGKLQVAINAIIHRSLHEMVDLDTAINGNLKYHGAFGKPKENQKTGAEAEIEAPVTLNRTVKVLKH